MWMQVAYIRKVLYSFILCQNSWCDAFGFSIQHMFGFILNKLN